MKKDIQPVRGVLAWAGAIATSTLLFSACGDKSDSPGDAEGMAGSENQGGQSGTGGKESLGGDAGGPSAQEVDEYLESLGAWNDFSPLVPDSNEPTGDGVDIDEVVGDTTYECTETPYSRWRTPKKIVMYEPNASLMWVGNLLQGEGYRDGLGSFEELPIRQRAPLKISIDLLSKDNFAIVEDPSLTSVQAAIGELIERASDAGHRSGSSIDFLSTRLHTATEAALSMGLSADLLGAGVPVELGASVEASFSADATAVMANYTQKMFTVSIELPQTPSSLFSDELTSEVLQEQIDAGNIGPDNLPVYVASITYGRTLTYTMIDAALEVHLKRAAEAAFSVEAIPISAESQSEISQVLEGSLIHALAIGGEGQNMIDLIRTQNLAAYFSSDSPLTTAKPISYQLNYLGDNSIAKVSEVANYTLRECEEKRQGSGNLAFSPNQTVTPGLDTPFQAMTGDVNGDGRVDLVMNHLQQENQTVIGLGQSDGTFAFGNVLLPPEGDWAQSGPGPGNWQDGFERLIGDFNGDGMADFAWNRRQNAEANWLYVALGEADGSLTFLEPQQLAGDSWATGWETLVGDIDGDGDDDLLFNYHVDGNFVYLGTSAGDGTFSLSSRFDHPVGGTGWNQYQSFVGDFDGDGLAELLWNRIPTTGAMNIWTTLSTGSSLAFEASRQDFLDGWPDYVAHAADIDGDLATDLALAKDTKDSSVYVHLARWNGSGFELNADVSRGDRPSAWNDSSATSQVGDFNGDGLADVVFNHKAAASSLLVGLGRSDGRVSFDTAAQSHPDLDLDWQGTTTLVGDVNGDGADEVIWVSPGTTTQVAFASPE